MSDAELYKARRLDSFVIEADGSRFLVEYIERTTRRGKIMERKTIPLPTEADLAAIVADAIRGGGDRED